MALDMPSYMTYMTLYVISASIVTTNTRSATHWKLQESSTGEFLVRPVSEEDTGKLSTEDPVMSILAQKYGFGEPLLNTNDQECLSCGKTEDGGILELSNPSDPLHCGKHANKTDYDSLNGIADRWKHPSIPEPEVALIFKRSDSDQVDMSLLENSLRETIKLNPSSLAVLNQVGNFWRIKGNTYLAIECFRKAISLSPTNPDILLNLARVLFNLQYHSDALFLTQKSLQFKTPDQNSWLQHFTLGEIFKVLGNYAEAGVHFRYALDLNPTFQPAEAHLREIEQPTQTNATIYTILIIGFLIVAVCVALYVVTEVYMNENPLRRSPKMAVPWDRSKFPMLKSKRGGSY
ncbi:uncharacterized protein LOC577463 [Strongylocentrotus purpuratus]|uniref:Tetratricopeptide repeat protein 17 n=1 Tax=Strongylocentrotus purpuratus TaxID=7668 RepID=A0A7M7RCX7_STRPU|nr:uncharacterized protein LOC577463 [Strongylocentrotus purpuratus]|eukprot:XP_782784.1 PREDICTED: uncharacterized protein LOC577463 [Strongylocentrotus purpuratus]